MVNRFDVPPEIRADDLRRSEGLLTNAEMRAAIDRMADFKKKTGSTENTEEGGDPLAKYEHDIRRFMDAMKYKLRKNAHKGRWENLDLQESLILLEQEVVELHDAIRDGNMVEIMLEAADVANFALMVAAIAMERGR